MDQPKGFVVEKKEDHVFQLNMSLYGLKHPPRQWYKRFDAFMNTYGLSKSVLDTCMYYKNMPEINTLKKLLIKEFDMKSLGAKKKILRMAISK